MSYSRLVLFTLATCLVLSSCGAVIDKATESASERAVEKMIEASGDGEIDIDRDGDSFSIKTEDGSMSVDGEGNMVIESDEGTATIKTSDELPDDFPDIPLPNDLIIESASRFADADGTVVHSVSARIERDASDTFDTFVADLADAGYTADFRNDSTTDGEFFGMAMLTKADGQQVSVNVIADDDSTIVQISVTALGG